MSLLDNFLQKIASLFEIEDISHVMISAEGISIASKTLPLDGVFFGNNDIADSATCSISDYLNQFEVKSDNRLTLQNTLDASTCWEVVRLQVINKNIQHGFYGLNNNSGQRNGILFTGSLSGSINQPVLTDFREAILALCVLDYEHTLKEVSSWAEIFEAIGPFAVCKEHEFPHGLLSDCGVFAFSNRDFNFSWIDHIPEGFCEKKDKIPQEAELAYIAALSNSSTPDIAFTRLYRVFEILFALGLKEKVANAHLVDIIKIFRDYHKPSELDMMSALFDGLPVSFSRFTKADFKELFDSHLPSGNYQKIAHWINDISAHELSNPPLDLTANIIYYIRCALVHSKLGEKEPFLLGPFTDEQINSLCHLVDDVRDIIKNLIY